MKVLIEVFVDIIVLALIAFIGLQFVTVNLEVQNARSFHQNVIEKIESSNNNQSVINQCMTDATTKYGANSLTVQNCSVYVNGEDQSPSYYVRLNYKIRIPFSSIVRTCTAEGYAR